MTDEDKILKFPNRLKDLQKQLKSKTLEERSACLDEMIAVAYILASACVKNSDKSTEDARRSGLWTPFYALANVDSNLGHLAEQVFRE